MMIMMYLVGGFVAGACGSKGVRGPNCSTTSCATIPRHSCAATVAAVFWRADDALY